MMIHHCKSHVPNGGFAPATPGFNAVAPEWLFVSGAAEAAPAIPAAESTLGSHPCVTLSSAQMLPEWINRNLADNAFATNGDNPLNFVSHARGSHHSLSQFPTAAHLAPRAASHTKTSHFRAHYLARGRGKNRALIAVAHSLLVTVSRPSRQPHNAILL